MVELPVRMPMLSSNFFLFIQLRNETVLFFKKGIPML